MKGRTDMNPVVVFKEDQRFDSLLLKVFLWMSFTAYLRNLEIDGSTLDKA